MTPTPETPLERQALELCWQIERLPASEQQTSVSIMASDLQRRVAAMEAELALAAQAVARTAVQAGDALLRLEASEQERQRAETERDEAGVLLDTVVFLVVEDYEVVDLKCYRENASKIAEEAIAFTFRPWVVEAVRKHEEAEAERLAALASGEPKDA